MNTVKLKDVMLGQGVRSYFPIFSSAGSDLHYLDTAASAQKPQCVIKRLVDFMGEEYANIHRGAYALSGNATAAYEAARAKIAEFIGADSSRSIVFTKNATESINLVANCYEKFLRPGDTVLLSLLEHHSNIVPWQLLAERKGIKLEWVDITNAAEISIEDLEVKLENYRPKLLAITATSNAFGSVLSIEKVVAAAARFGTKVLIDACQILAHESIDVVGLDVDFMVFSGHKLYGPTGIGVLYAKQELLDRMDPFMGGGGMISVVATERTTWADTPHKFEAGTPPIAEAVALGAAIEFLEEVGLDRIQKYEEKLFADAFELLAKEPGVTLYGPAAWSGKQSCILSFNVKDVHPHDLSSIADSVGVQVRAGHHCAMPALRRLGIPASVRASIGMYSTFGDFEALVEAIRKAQKVLG